MADPSSFEGEEYAFIQDLIGSIPELAAVVRQASAEGATPQRFEALLMATSWWRSNSSTVRSVLALKASDPATYQQKLQQAQAHVEHMATQFGMQLSSAQMSSFATAALMQGLSDEQLGDMLAKNYNGGPNVKGGSATDLRQQLSQLEAQYGVPVTMQWEIDQTRQALLTGGDLSAAKQDLMNQAMSLYKPFADQIKAGQTVSQLAQPYMAQMAQTLEVPESTLSLKDPTIAKAMQTSYHSTGADGKPVADNSVIPLYDFANQLRQDPRWQQTGNAKQEAYSMVEQLGKSFGFSA